MKKSIFISIIFLLFSCEKEEKGEVPIVVTSSQAFEITYRSITCGGTVIAETSPTTARGICWKFGEPSTLDLEHNDGVTFEGKGEGNFISKISKLTSGRKYSFCAYATNSFGTGYGDIVSFEVKSIQAPLVETISIVEITETSAKVLGRLIDAGDDEGGIDVESGVCWSTEPSPKIVTNPSASATEGKDGYFKVTIPNLSPYTTYYARAYAWSIAGESYGEELSFRTKGSNSN